MKKLLIVGATSAIAQATLRLYAEEGAILYLVGRDPARLQAVADDARVRGAGEVYQSVLDLNDLERHEFLAADAREKLGEIDVLLIAHGTLGDQKASEGSWDAALRELQTNCLSVLSLLTRFAGLFESQGRGTMAVIASVAGDRGRQSNYVYGTAKGALGIFLQGLRNRLHRHGVQVLTIKPGFVDTPMTAAFRKGALWATPGQIARGIKKAIERRKDVVYLPGFWRPVMWVIRSIPEALFKRLSL